MQLMNFTGVALLALLVMVLPALAHKQHWNVIRDDWRDPLRMLFGVLTDELGASILYAAPTFSATAPTAAQSSNFPTLVAQITFADGDTTIPFVHNWGAVMGPSAPTYGYPEINAYWLSQTASPASFQSSLTFGITNTNQVTINKTSVGVGSGGVLIVNLRRPHSIGL